MTSDRGDPHDHPRARAAAALRRLGHALSERDADDQLLERIAVGADQVTASLDDVPHRERDLVELKRRMFDTEVADGERVVHFDECFVSGPWNPLGIAIDVHRDGDEAVGRVELGAAFEGAPGRSHGGIVAAILDDVLGYQLALLRTVAFTGELTVRYHAPTPIGRPLEFRSRFERREGRKLHLSADARTVVDGRPTETVASASAIFVAIEVDRLRG